MNINKIKISGTTYNIQDENACNVVELTQAQYDALPATAKTSNSLFVITDATGADLSNYYTKSETSGATQISTALASKQTTLTAGTNITIVDNVISATGGGGGGSSYQAGTNISIDNDTINCTVPASASSGSYSIMFGRPDSSGDASGSKSMTGGQWSKAYSEGSVAIGQMNESRGPWAWAIGNGTSAEGKAAFACGEYNSTNNQAEFTCGFGTITSGGSDTSIMTLFTVGNGKWQGGLNRHNAFDIRMNGDIYISDTNSTSVSNYWEKPMIKLQDALGGGGSSYTAGDGIDITNDVISVTGKVDTSAITTSITSANTNTQLPSAKAVYDQLGGLKLVKLSQSAYDSLATKDSNTLYVIEEAPECNTPQGATYHAVDDNFDKTTQVYGIDFSNYDALNNEPTTFTVDLNSANNIEYTVDVTTNNAEPYFTTTVTRGTETVYTADVAGFNFCEVFGEPMYISAFPSYETCVNEQCTEYDCLQYDEETGECIEQGDCISTECIETQTNYPMTALY